MTDVKDCSGCVWQDQCDDELRCSDYCNADEDSALEDFVEDEKIRFRKDFNEFLEYYGEVEE